MSANSSKSFLSWDIGIKNLAYCIVKINNNKTYGFEITKWGIIDLCDEKECTEKTKFNKKCTAIASFYHGDNFYCKKHKNNYVKETCEIITIKNSQSTCIYVDNKKNVCKKKATRYIDNIENCYCGVHSKTVKNKNDRERNLKTIVNNANKIPLETLALKLYEELDKHPEFLEVDEILIENQPSLTNPTMKSMMMLLYSYLMLYGKSSHKKNNSRIENIKLISPSNKIKVSDSAVKKIKNKKNRVEESKENNLNEDNENNKNIINNKKKVYDITKSLGIKLCKELIKDDIDNTALLNNFKKKDDLCDAFLQAFHYIFCRKSVPPNILSLLNNIVDVKELTVDTENIDINLDINDDLKTDSKNIEESTQIIKPKKKYNRYGNYKYKKPAYKSKKGITLNV